MFTVLVVSRGRLFTKLKASNRFYKQFTDYCAAYFMGEAVKRSSIITVACTKCQQPPGFAVCAGDGLLRTVYYGWAPSPVLGMC